MWIPPLECRITKPFIWDRSQLWNHDINNPFPKNENIGVQILPTVHYFAWKKPNMPYKYQPLASFRYRMTTDWFFRVINFFVSGFRNRKLMSRLANLLVCSLNHCYSCIYNLIYDYKAKNHLTLIQNSKKSSMN